MIVTRISSPSRTGIGFLERQESLRPAQAIIGERRVRHADVAVKPAIEPAGKPVEMAVAHCVEIVAFQA